MFNWYEKVAYKISYSLSKKISYLASCYDRIWLCCLLIKKYRHQDQHTFFPARHLLSASVEGAACRQPYGRHTASLQKQELLSAHDPHGSTHLPATQAHKRLFEAFDDNIGMEQR